MKKPEPELKERTETIVSDGTRVRVEVVCKSSVLIVPAEPPEGGVSPELAHYASRMMPKFGIEMGDKKYEANYEIKVTAKNREQVIELDHETLMRVFKVVGKVIPEAMAGGLMGGRVPYLAAAPASFED